MRRLWVAFFFLGFATVSAASTPQEITITLTATHVKASGLTHSGKAVIVGVLREPRTYYSITRPVAAIVNVDASGNAEYRVDMLHRSQWAVIDLATGAVSLAAPKGFGVHSEDLLASDFANGRLRATKPEGVVWVRPELGAWAGSVGDAAVAADVSEDAGPFPPCDGAEPLPGGNVTTPPTALQAGDVVIAIDADEMAMYVRRGNQ